MSKTVVVNEVNEYVDILATNNGKKLNDELTKILFERANGDNTSTDEIKQIALSRCYQYEFDPKLARSANLSGNSNFYNLRASLENDFKLLINNEFSDKSYDSLVENMSEKEFIDFIKDLMEKHSSHRHQLFSEYLLKHANFEDFKFFLAQEKSPRFDDLLSLIQIGSSIDIKLEFSKNYWDEMGNGDKEKVHAEMFSKIMEYFQIEQIYVTNNILLSSRIFDNLSAIFSLYRENFSLAVGFLAVTEYSVPARFEYFVEGCKRIGIPDKCISYHMLHTDIDGEHSEAWFNEIIVPMIRNDKSYMKEILKGVIIKLKSTQYYFDEILTKLKFGE